MTWEFSILYFLQSVHNGFMDQFMTFITKFGDVGLFWVFTGIILFCIKKTRRVGFCMLLSLVCGLLLGNVLLKNLIARDRPCWIDSTIPLLVHIPDDFSFPSGHTLASFEGAVSIFLYHKKWGIAAIVLACMIAFSRLYLFVHFPTDVLAGLIMGIAIAWLVHVFVEKYAVLNKISGKGF